MAIIKLFNFEKTINLKNNIMRIKILSLAFFSIFLLSGECSYGAEYNVIRKQTFLYSVKGTDSLYLDKYDLPEMVSEKEKPCMIFVFGGAFTHGQRDAQKYLPYFEHLMNKGYTVVSIDYRLGLKNALTVKEVTPNEFIALFDKSISMATEDLYDATRYILNNVVEWNIDPSAILVTGSSAGAITALHGEYGICNQSELCKVLPVGFNYAGIISCAGAIFSKTGGLNWGENPVPILLLHGDADKNVPYDKIEISQIGLYGSKYIAEQLNLMSNPSYFYDIENSGHEVSEESLIQNQNEIDIFLDRFVHEKRPLIIHEKIRQLDKPLMPKDFSLEDYIKANM